MACDIDMDCQGTAKLTQEKGKGSFGGSDFPDAVPPTRYSRTMKHHPYVKQATDLSAQLIAGCPVLDGAEAHHRPCQRPPQ